MKSGRILIVEDEAIVGLELEQRLRALGYEVVGVASTGEEALELAERHRPDLALMDIMLPGSLDGAQAAALLRERLGIASLFLSAYSDDSTLERVQGAEPYGYLLKPYDERLLHVTLQSALYRSLAEREHKDAESQRARVDKADALARLAASVVHDVNNLLSSIRCNAFLIQSQPRVDDDTLEAASDIMTAVERGERSMRKLVQLAHETPAAEPAAEISELSEQTARLGAIEAKPETTTAAEHEPVARRSLEPCVLLVDDDPVVRRAVSRFLRNWGYVVLEADSPSAAIALLETAHVDLLITDLIMPGMTGYELSERVLGAQPNVRVVYMSGYAPDALTAEWRLKRDPTPAFLQKPFAVDALKRVVTSTLDASRAG